MHNRKQSQVVSGQSSSIGMHIVVQGVEIPDSSRKSDTFSGDLMIKFQKFEKNHGLNLKAVGVESDYTVPQLTGQAGDALVNSGKFPETSGEVSKVSPIISQININKTLESKRSQCDSQLEEEQMEDDEQLREVQINGNYNNQVSAPSSKRSGSANQFKQYKQVLSMPQSLHSIHSQISQLSIPCQLRKMAPDSSRTSRQDLGVSGLVSSRQAKVSQTCGEGQELLTNDLQTYQKDDMAFAEDGLGGPTTLISHLNEDQSQDANEFVTTTKQLGGESQDLRIHQATDSDINIRGAIRSVKRGEELIDDELVSPRNRLDHLSIEAIEGTGGALSTKDIHQLSQQITAENLLKYLDTKYKEKKQENSSVFEHSRASHLSEQHRHSSRKSPIAHTRKLGFNPSSQPAILSDRKPSPHALTSAEIPNVMVPALADRLPPEQLNLAQAQLQVVHLEGPNFLKVMDEQRQQPSPEAVLESKVFDIDQQNHALPQQHNQDEDNYNYVIQQDGEDIMKEIVNQQQTAISVLETVEERIQAFDRTDELNQKLSGEPKESLGIGQSPMRTLTSIKQSDELNKYLDSDIQSDSSRSPAPRAATQTAPGPATHKESNQNLALQQVIAVQQRDVEQLVAEDHTQTQNVDILGEEQEEIPAAEPQNTKSLLEVEQKVQEEIAENETGGQAVQPEMNINSDLTTLNFDPDNSSSSDGRGPPFNGPAGSLLVPGQAGQNPEANYQMFMNAKKADQKCLNQFRRRQKRNQQQLSEQELIQKQQLGINLDQIEIDIQENSLKGQSSDNQSEQLAQHPPTDTDGKYTSRSEGENNDAKQTIFLEDIKFDQDEPKTERNHNIDKIDSSEASDENLFDGQDGTNGQMPGQKIKISDIINRKRKSKKSLSGGDGQSVNLKVADGSNDFKQPVAENMSQLLDIKNISQPVDSQQVQNVDVVGENGGQEAENVSKDGEDGKDQHSGNVIDQKSKDQSQLETKSPIKKVISSAQKEIEVFNPPVAAKSTQQQVVQDKTDQQNQNKEPKVLSVEEYHEGLFTEKPSADSSTAPKTSPEAVDAKDKSQIGELNQNDRLNKSGEKPSQPGTGNNSATTYKELKTDEVYELLRASINQGELKHQIRQVIEMKQRQNIERDLIRADSYVNELLEYLLQFEIPQGIEDPEQLLLEVNGVANYLAIFLTSLTQPQRREVMDELRKMQTQELGSYSHFESCLDPLQFAILPIDMYLDVEKQRQFTYQLTHQEETREKDLKKQYNSANSAFSAISALSNSITQESQHILHKAIFDAMNESLTKFRPYGMVGEPLPWSNKYRRLQTEVDINSVDTERLFQMVKQEVYRWMSAQQGALTHQRATVFQYIDLHIPLLPEIEERIHAVEGGDKSLTNFQKLQMQTPKELKNLQESQIGRLQGTMIEEATQDMRQAKLANLLHQEIIEDEHQWLNYEFEETQIRIDLGEMILESLLQETIDFLNTKNPSDKDSPTESQNEQNQKKEHEKQ